MKNTDETLRKQIEALPIGTNIKLGWEIRPGYVQGSLYLRTQDGLRYIGPGRDNHDHITLVQETYAGSVEQPNGFTIVAVPLGITGPQGSCMGGEGLLGSRGEE